MQIDNKNFIEFMQSLYFNGYYIKYIDKAHEQSICKNSATLIYETALSPQRLFYKSTESMLQNIETILSNQDFSKRESDIITTIFLRIGNALICIKHKNF